MVMNRRARIMHKKMLEGLPGALREKVSFLENYTGQLTDFGQGFRDGRIEAFTYVLDYIELSEAIDDE